MKILFMLLQCISLSAGAFAVVTLKSVSVAPASAFVAVGGSQQFTATAKYSNGSTSNVTASASWSSSSSGVATVSGGLVHGIAAGSASITALYSGKSGSASLTVNPNPPPPGTTVVNFDNPGCPNGNGTQSLTGIFQGINWGNSPWDCEVAGSPTDTTTSTSWNQNVTTGTFSFINPSILISLKAGTTVGSGTYSISTDSGENISQLLIGGNPLTAINTGFTKAATAVTISFTGGWTVETDDIVYGPPSQQTCTPIQHQVSLSWNESDPSVSSFNLYRSPSSGGPYSQIQTGITGASTVDNAVQSASTYFYVVTAFNGQESTYSNETTAIVPCP